MSSARISPWGIVVVAFSLFLVGPLIPSLLYEAVLASIAVTILTSFAASAFLASVAERDRRGAGFAFASLTVLGATAALILGTTWHLLRV